VVLVVLLGHRVTEWTVRSPGAGPTDGVGSATSVVEVHALRIRAKDRIVQDLASGRSSLLEAAALFRELDRVPPEVAYPAVLYPAPPLQLESPTAEERYCILVINYVRNTLRGSEPERARALAEQLVEEFWAAKGRPEGVRLPDVTGREPVRELLERARSGSLKS
jgi:hypothetical protein